MFKHTGSADQTMMYFDVLQNYTVDSKGAKEIKVRSIDYKKQHITVMLFIAANGHKLLPYVVLSSKIIPKNEAS
jgi:hypothetical protein